MDKELPISPWPEWKIVSKIGEGSFGRVYKAQRTEKGRSFYSAIKIITIPASKGELDSVRSESGDEKSVRGYFENLVEECIQEVSTMEYFRGNSHIVSVEDYKVMEYLDEIGWDIFIRMEYLTSFMEYYAGKNLTEKEVMKLGIDLCRSLEYCGQLHIIHRISNLRIFLYPGSGISSWGLWNRQRTGKNHEYLPKRELIPIWRRRCTGENSTTAEWTFMHLVWCYIN